MCIICNVSPEDGPFASHFLNEFEAAQKAMERDRAAMLLVSQKATDPLVHVRYDQCHKEMVSLSRQWNKLEELREHAE